jgi:hypothetical protein
MDHFVGVNLRREDPTNYLRGFGFVREFHDWDLDEGDFLTCGLCNTPNDPQLYPYNTYQWNPSWQGKSNVRFDDFYKRLNAAIDPTVTNPALTGAHICATMKGCLPALSGGNAGAFNEFKPIKTTLSGTFHTSVPPNFVAIDDPSLPNSYENYADWAYQFAARYGHNTTVPAGTLKNEAQGDQVVGLGQVRYMEIWNEQDKNWFDGLFQNGSPNMTQFTPAEYAAMLSAAYDGQLNSISGDGTSIPYNVGLHNADNNMRVVLGAVWSIDDVNFNFVQGVTDHLQVLRGANGHLFLDVLNFHHYSDANWLGDSGTGVHPEGDINNSVFFKQRMHEIRTWVDNEYGLETELWMSEFGYDTNINSPHKAIEILANPLGENNFADLEETQARWIVRSYLEIVAAGWDRAMLFDFRDNDSDREADANAGRFESSGALKTRYLNYAPKKSYYYTASMRNILAGKAFVQEGVLATYNQYGTTAADPRIMLFREPNDPTVNKITYAVWLPTATNEGVQSYQMRLLGAPGTIQNLCANLITLEVGDEDGKKGLPLPIGLDAEGYFVIVPELTEKPVFIELGASCAADAVVACPTVTAQPISCDAVLLKWPHGANEDRYMIYYYEENDSENGSVPTVVDLQDPRLVLYTDEFLPYYNPTMCGTDGEDEIIVAGLKKPMDSYTFYVRRKTADGRISGANCPTQVASTVYCANNLRVVGNSGINVSPACMEYIFNTDNVEFCNPQTFDLTTERQWTSMPGDDGVIQAACGNSVDVNSVEVTFTTPHYIDAIRLLDGTSDGYLKVSVKFQGQTVFTDPIEYYTLDYNLWNSIFVSNCAPIEALRFEADPNNTSHISKIVLFGYPANSIALTPDCCIVPNATEIESTSISQVIASNVLPANESNGQPIVLSGLLTIDQDYVFSESDLVMRPSSEILVKSGRKLTIKDNSSLNGCTNLWKGITVEKGGKIEVSQSAVRDAESAITMLDYGISGTPTGLSFWNLTSAKFERNLRGLVAESSTTYQNPIFFPLDPSSLIRSTVFDGTEADLLPHYDPNQIGYLPKAISGIEAEKCWVRIVNNTLTFDNGKPSVFQNLGSGIMGAGFFYIDATKFANIEHRDDYPNLYTGRGIATKSYFGKIITRPHIVLTGLGKYASIPTFENVETGVYSSTGTTLDVSQSRFIGGQNGIVCIEPWTFSQVSASTIDNNYFKTEGTAISLDNVFYPETNVTNNEIEYENITLNGIQVTGSFNFVPSGYPEQIVVKIEHNQIKVRAGENEAQVGAGIALLGNKNILVRDNHIQVQDYTANSSGGSTTMSDPAIYGIYQSNSTKNILCENAITGFSSNNGMGIYSQQSPLNNIHCNTFNDLRYGLGFEMLSPSDERIKGNRMAEHRIGLILNAVEDINGDLVYPTYGTQTHTGNYWTDTDLNGSQFGAVFDGDLNDPNFIDELATSLTKVTNMVATIDPHTLPNPGTLPGWPMSAVVPHDGSWFFQDQIISSDFQCGTGPVCGPAMPSVGKLDGFFGKIVEGEIDMSTWPHVYREMAKRAVYNQLVDMSGLPAAEQAFVDNFKQTRAGQLAIWDKDLAQAYALGQTEAQSFEQSIMAVSNLVAGLEPIWNLNDQLISPTGTPVTAMAQTEALFSEMEAQNSLSAIVEAHRLSDVETLRKKNDNFFPTQPEEVWEKHVNQLIIDILLDPALSTNAAKKQQIFTASLLCPQSYGYASLKARALYVSLYKELPKAWEDCTDIWEDPAGTGGQQYVAVDKVTDLIMLPNPTRSIMQVQVAHQSIQGTNQWAVVDLFGRELIKGSTDDGHFELQVQDLPEGTYVLQVEEPNGHRLSRQFVVLH